MTQIGRAKDNQPQNTDLDEWMKSMEESNVPSQHYLTAIGPCNPDGYNAEFHQDMGPQTCEICLRLFSEHSQEEFVTHWDELAARGRKQAAVRSSKLSPP